jgi:hypothetical protein
VTAYRLTDVSNAVKLEDVMLNGPELEIELRPVKK